MEQRVHQLEQILEKAKIFEPYVPEDLAQGEDVFQISIQVYEPWDIRGSGRLPTHTNTVIFKDSFFYTWNELFTDIAPCLMVEASFESIEKSLKQSIYKYLRLPELDKSPHPLDCIEILCDDVRTIILQLKALKLISESLKKHSITDINEYWSLTQYGQNLMLKLSPIKREN
ncbi:MAG: hypothetical protein VKK42_00685 [Lyngbya sp.]|nr:hypothetical protein [Lyngbya sp.]